MRKTRPDKMPVAIEDFINGWRRERPDLDPSPLAIFGRAQRLSSSMIRATEELLEPLQLSWEVFCVILALRRSGKPYVLRPTDIYRQSLITSATATNRIDRASERGLVRRLPDPNDRRGILVELTAAGKKLADRAIEMQFAMLAKQLSVLTRSERAQLGDLLAKLLPSSGADKELGAQPSYRTSERKQRQSLSVPVS
jgi:DNA-binding MarR family transcriptional regulator